MTAPLSPALSDMSSPCWCSEEEGSDANADSDYCSPEMKRAKRLDSAEPGHSDDKTPKENFLKTKILSGIKESDSRLSFRSLGGRRSRHSIEYDRNSIHSLPNLDFKALALSNPAQSMRQSSVENIGRVDSGENSAQFERRSSLDNIFGDRADDEAELKSDRKARVVSSYYSHFKEHQQLVGRAQGSPETGSTNPSHFVEDLESMNEAANDRVDTGFEVSDEVKTKFGVDEVTYESDDDHIRKILMPTPLETLIGSRENFENWSTTNSLLEDDAVPTRLKSAKTPDVGTKAAKTAQTPEVNAGDSQMWHSHVEKAFKSELEFSTLVTLAYVRVRDLTNTISKANTYLEAIDKNEGQEEKEKGNLRSEIQALFEERANLALEHSKWRCEFSELYQLRKKVLSNLKSQAAQAEQSYFILRKELEDLQNEPVVTKRRRSWFSRMCAFMK